MPKTYTGNEDIDRYLRRNISPNYQISDDSTYRNEYFLKYIRDVGSQKDIDYVMTQYFNEEHLQKVTNKTIIETIIHLGYCLDFFSKHPNPEIRLIVLQKGYRPEAFLRDNDYRIVRELAKKRLRIKHSHAHPSLRHQRHRRKTRSSTRHPRKRS